MKSVSFMAITFASWLMVATSFAQTNCPNGRCPQSPFVVPFAVEAPAPVVAIAAQEERIIVELTAMPDTCDVTGGQPIPVDADAENWELVSLATVRVTVGGSCGSGTVVGRDEDGSALVLTNAHVAGTRKGRDCNVQRWKLDGTSEKGTATVIAAGLANRSLPIDFALLKANGDFAKSVVPIPLTDREPDGEVITNGCPRCEWPSMQLLRLTDTAGAVYYWDPIAIPGRSGSGLFDFADGLPKLVALLTWHNGRQGMGQSSKHVIAYLRGQIPTGIEALPEGTQPVSTVPQESESDESTKETGIVDRKRKVNRSFSALFFATATAD